ACNSGRLILNPIGTNGPVELLWHGPSMNRGILSAALLQTVKAGWCTMLHKPVDLWHPIKFRDGLFWLNRLPRARYLLEANNQDGVDLYRIEHRIVRPRGAVLDGWRLVISPLPGIGPS